MIEALPVEQLNNEIIGQLARAYINVQKLWKSNRSIKKHRKRWKKYYAWNYRMGCSYFYLKDYEKAEEYFFKSI